MNITDIIATIIAAVIAAFGGGTTADVNDTAAPFAGATPVADQVTPDPPCAGEGCNDPTVIDRPAYTTTPATTEGTYHLPVECADGSVECVCTPDHGCRAVGAPPSPLHDDPCLTEPGFDYGTRQHSLMPCTPATERTETPARRQPAAPHRVIVHETTPAPINVHPPSRLDLIMDRDVGGANAGNAEARCDGYGGKLGEEIREHRDGDIIRHQRLLVCYGVDY